MNTKIELTKEEVRECLKRALIKNHVNKSENEIENMIDEILYVNKRGD